jgi:hypothetical protein
LGYLATEITAAHREKKKPQRDFVCLALFSFFLLLCACGDLCGQLQLNFRQGLIEITQHVDLIFQADRNSHQTFIDSSGFSEFARKLKAPH